MTLIYYNDCFKTIGIWKDLCTLRAFKPNA